MSSKKTIKSAFESMMFTWGDPLQVKDAAEVFNISKEEALECFLELQQEYEQEGRGIVIRRINQSFQFVTREENADYVRSLCTPEADPDGGTAGDPFHRGLQAAGDKR